MASIEISIDDAALQAAFNRLLNATSDLTPAMKNIGEYMVTVTKDRFEDERGPDGQPWQAWAPSTVLRKQKKTKGIKDKILRDQGDLFTSIVYRASSNSVVVGTNRIYGAIHQFGGQAGRNRSVDIPARPYLGANSDDIREIQAIILAHLDDAWSG